MVRAGSQVRVFSAQREKMVTGEVEDRRWQDAVVYLVRADGEIIEARDNQISPAGVALDWQLWKPATGRVQELQLNL